MISNEIALQTTPKMKEQSGAMISNEIALRATPTISELGLEEEEESINSGVNENLDQVERTGGMNRQMVEENYRNEAVEENRMNELAERMQELNLIEEREEVVELRRSEVTMEEAFRPESLTEPPTEFVYQHQTTQTEGEFYTIPSLEEVSDEWVETFYALSRGSNTLELCIESATESEHGSDPEAEQ